MQNHHVQQGTCLREWFYTAWSANRWPLVMPHRGARCPSNVSMSAMQRPCPGPTINNEHMHSSYMPAVALGLSLPHYVHEASGDDARHSLYIRKAHACN